jgi:phosphoesterase RecJ-like protein
MSGNLRVPEHRRAPLEAIRTALDAAHDVVLTTHVNADGDGAGSEAAIGAWLLGLGKTMTIANPTPFPAMFRHLVADGIDIVDPGAVRTPDALSRADTIVVLDTGEPRRIGRIAAGLGGRTVIVIDHHLPSEAGIEGVTLRDESACATGDLVFDLIELAGLARPWSPHIVEGIYTAILTDTGSFRFSNSTPRAHAIAGDLITQGVDPEEVYRRIYATVPLRRIRLLSHALDHLQVDDELPITWITIERGVMERLGATSDDLEGVVDHARSIEGTEVALLFRETSDGSTKVSFRSAGSTNVNAIARQFGGGGHEKASGALIGSPLASVRDSVLDATRAALRAYPPFRAKPGSA